MAIEAHKCNVIGCSGGIAEIRVKIGHSLTFISKLFETGIL